MEVIARIKSKGGEATFVKSDVGSEDAVRALVEETVSIYGKLDGAVNNAGISTDAALFADLDTQKFQDMLQINVLGLFWCMKFQVSLLNIDQGVLRLERANKQYCS